LNLDIVLIFFCTREPEWCFSVGCS